MFIVRGYFVLLFVLVLAGVPAHAVTFLFADLTNGQEVPPTTPTNTVNADTGA